MNLDRIYSLLERYPLQITIALLGGCIGFLVLLRVFRIRMGFPAILFGSLLLILAGSSSMAYLQILSKGIFRWMALATVAAMAIFYLPRSRLALNRPTPVHWGWMAFLALATATAPLSGHPTFALLNCVAVSVLFVAAFGTVWFFTSDGRSVVSLIEVVHCLAIVILVLGVLFIAMPKAPGEVGETTEEGRFLGFFNNANWNGNFSALVLPVLLWKRHYPRSRFEKRMTSVAVALFAVNIVLSGSRGAILGGFTAALLAQWRLDKTVVTRNLMLAIPLVTLVLASEVGRQYFENHAEKLARLEAAKTLTHRTEMWEQAWPTIKQHWLTGVGLGNSRFILLTSHSEEQEAEQIGGTAANLHSQYVVTLAETGIVGLLLLAIFMLFICFKGMGLWRVPRTPFSDLSFVLVCSCLFAFADGIVHGWMFSAGSPYALLFWSLVVLCLKSERLAQAERAARSEARAGRMSAEKAMVLSSRPDPIKERARRS